MDTLARGLLSRPPPKRLTWREFRERSKARFAAELRVRFFLRFHIVVILAGAVLAGMLTSALALDIGVHSMAWRYLLGLGVAYLTFLALVRLWIAYVEGWRPDFPDPKDLSDGYDFISSSVRAFEPGGGHFGGGGANGSWGDASSASSAADGDSAGFDLDLDEGLPILLVAVVAFAVLGGLFYLVAVGPGILTEAAFEVALAGSLARRTGWAPDGRWLNHVVRSTVLPFIVVAGLTAASASFAQELCPTATRLREIVECINL